MHYKISHKNTRGAKGIKLKPTSAETATASNQSSHFRAFNKGLNRVSKFDTTATPTPSFLRARKTFPAFGSQSFQAFKSNVEHQLQAGMNSKY